MTTITALYVAYSGGDLCQLRVGLSFPSWLLDILCLVYITFSQDERSAEALFCRDSKVVKSALEPRRFNYWRYQMLIFEEKPMISCAQYVVDRRAILRQRKESASIQNSSPTKRRSALDH
jgi:hypothetical protein